MLRSMYSGISGMKNFQTKLDVIGNNIANVNTYGFKKGRVTFQDMMNQEISGASASGQGTGGVNAKQVGLGTSLAAIDTVHSQGSLQTTARSLDLALSGDGFFVVGSVSDPTGIGLDGDNKIYGAINNAMSVNYTRAGNFYLDEKGYLVNSSGLYVIGQTGEKNLPVEDDIEAANAALLAADTFKDKLKSFAQITENYYEAAEAALQARQNYEGAGGNEKETAKTSLEGALKALEEAKIAFSGDEEDNNSNIEPGGSLKIIIDELGKLDGSDESSFNKAIHDFNGKSGDLSTKNIPNDSVKEVDVDIDKDSLNSLEELKAVVNNAEKALTFIDQLQATHDNFVTVAEMFMQPNWSEYLSDSAGLIQIPKTAESFSIGSDGTVTFVDQLGNLRIAGRLLLAKLDNSSGLQKVGDNLFKETSNSGSVDADGNGIQLNELFRPGENGTATITTGSLEMSNVDLSEEFTEMITAQRGFQANTKIISTSDEILQELVNLKR